MKTYKKIGLGLSFAIVFSLIGLSSHKAYAAGIASAAWPNAQYNLTDANTVEVTVAAQTFKFTYNQFGVRCGNGSVRCYEAPSALQTAFCNNDSYVRINTSDYDISKTTIPGAVYADYVVQPSAIPACKQFGKPNQPVPIKNITVSLPASTTGGQTGTTASGGASAQPTCESSSFTNFEWLFCPVLKLFDSMTTTFNKILENLLNFNVSDNLTPQVKSSWTIMKTIASALLVIIMLVAVISQAIGGGPVDAYTLRKILPRLVAAVIIIQLSWVMLIWGIGLANDVGHGVRDLISAPFGGWENLDLEHLIAPLGLGGTALTAGLFTALITTAVFSGITIAGIGLLGLTAVLSMLVAFAVLILRKMFIILLVILFPIAMIAWILPGTQRYWKFWWDNFIKLMLLFPLIMALVYGGRIFAHIAVGAGSSAGATDAIIAVFVLFIGFFAPYWFLPRAFRWGGQMFGALSTGAMNATKGVRGFPAKYSLGQSKLNREQRAIDRAERLANNRGRSFDRLLAGRYNLASGRTTRRNRFQDTLEQGRKASDEAAARSVIGGQYEQLDHPDKVAADILVAQGRLDDQYGTGMDGRHAATQRAALERLAQYGDWDAIAAVREGGYMGEEGERVWQQFVAKNIGPIHKNMPHLSPQRTDLSQVGYREFYEMKNDGYDEVLRQAEGGFVRDATTGALMPAPDAAAKRAAHIDQAQRALEDTQFMAAVGQHGRDILTQIAALPQLTPDTVVTPTRVGVNVSLPNSAALRSNPTSAIESLNTNVMSTDPATAQATQVELARQLSSPDLGAADRQIYENYLLQLKNQAGVSAEARNAYNTVVTSWRGQVSRRPVLAERTAAAVGATPAEIAAARTNSEGAARAEYQRMVASGITPV